ncbi:MAG: hypothetical protein QOF91_477 [Alphaproteobacteria bacterium]|jgi:hypothetical protein|nr:hypothetical protein [Alphaproteobacteria bacterium]
MKIAALFAGLLLVATSNGGAQAADHPVVGSWKLVSFKVQASDTQETKDALGPNPTGRMILTPNGYITIYRIAGDRKPAKTDAERLALLQSMAIWTGRYRVEGDKLLIRIDGSWIEVLTNTDVTRSFARDGNRLTLTNTISSSLFFPGRPAVGTEVFELEE